MLNMFKHFITNLSVCTVGLSLSGANTGRHNTSKHIQAVTLCSPRLLEHCCCFKVVDCTPGRFPGSIESNWQIYPQNHVHKAVRVCSCTKTLILSTSVHEN